MVQMPTPTEEDIESFQCERARSYITKLPTLQGGRGPAHWKRQFPTANPNALDLLDKLLVLNPNQRLTVDQASHRWVTAPTPTPTTLLPPTHAHTCARAHMHACTRAHALP